MFSLSLQVYLKLTSQFEQIISLLIPFDDNCLSGHLTVSFVSILYPAIVHKGLAWAAALNILLVNNTFNPSKYARVVGS